MTSLRLQLSLLFLFPVALLLGNTISASADDAVLKNGYTDPPLTDFLNPDGSLNVTPGFSGQIDIAGYHIQLDECAGPVAVPDGMASATGTWSALGSGLNNKVNTIAVAANGDLYVGGAFTEAGGISADRIAKWDGTNWSALGSGLNSECRTIAIAPNGDVYAGGIFSTAGGVTVDDIAVWDGTNWSAVGSGSSVFSCLALAFASDGTLYAGGSWVNIGGVRSFSIASWDGTDWSALGAGLANSSGTIGFCLDIAIAPDGSVYAAGEFATAGGTPALNIAKWDGTSWSALGAGTNARVNAIDFASDGTLYATGDFTEAGGSPAGAIAKWDGTNWSPLGSGLGFTGFDFGFGIKAASDGNVYVTGQFSLTAGGFTSDRNIAKWDGTSWSGVGTGLSSSTNDVVESPSGDIYVGGSFGADNDFPFVTLNNIARLIPPVPCDIAITSVDKTDETCPGEDDGSITINASCNSCASILYSIDGGTTTQTSPTFSGLTPGTYQPYVEDSGDDTCTDAAAGETIADGIDSEAPSISCPGTITTAVLGQNCQKTLSDYTPFVNASDNCDTELTLSQSPAAGTIITGEQDLVVTVTATDNANLMNSCTYTVPLRDITFPEIDCPENVIVQATAATCTPIVNDIEATASDNCTVNPDISYTTTGATVTSGSGSAMLSGTSFSVGGTIVTYTATDDAMQPNEANCSFIITVQDNTDCGCGNPQPGDSCDDGDSETDNDVIQDDCSCAGTSCDIALLSVNETDETCPEEGDGTITINASCTSCDGILYSIDGGATTQTSPTFTGLMPGNYQPYVVDSGDPACSDEAAEVMINDGVDTEPPSFSCPPSVSVNVDAGTCGAVVDYSVSVSDNCSIVTNSGSGGGADVLLLYDQNTSNTTSLKNAIEAGGHTVTLAFAGGFNGTNPSLASFDAVIHLEGLPYGNMPVAGRTALADFAVNQGGVYIGTEFIGFNVDFVNSYLEMKDLILLEVSCDNGCGSSAVEYSTVAGQENHPVLANVPGSFTLPSSYHYTAQLRTFNSNPAIALMENASLGVTAAYREFPGGGKAVHFGHSAHYTAGGAVLSDPNAQLLFLNAVNLAATGSGFEQNSGLSSGEVFPVGVTTNSFTATDVAGNVAACSFTVTVTDNEAPTAICPTISDVMITENRTATLPANIGQGLSTDNCGTPTESSPMLSFDCDDLGPQTVTLTADDGNGNTDSEHCSFMVVLPDGLPNGWTASDIGTQNSDYSFDPCVAGPTDYNISTDGYHLLPNTSDNMAFASLPLCGNGGIQARIEDVEGGYAGLMIRESSAPGAKMTAIYSNLTNLLRRETRYTTNGARSSGLINAAFPTMLRLVRQGDWIRGFYKNSSQWVLFHQVYLPMDECVEMGLAVFSTDPFGTATATFDKVNFMSGMNLSAPNTGPIADALADVQRARIAPNPTSGAFTLDFERPLEIAATAVLRNELGQALQQLQLPAGAVNHNFDGSNLPRGLYFLEVRDAQGYREVLKVVRQ
ncbi:MAG: HYR domain-containing protein [Phaeodactylibacter sp.]|uniref:HYR domain-containing protein n=1 Tax=Phaeodactylibacter sp. TaxID=1940289 RepID=UPI0032EAE8C1